MAAPPTNHFSPLTSHAPSEAVGGTFKPGRPEIDRLGSTFVQAIVNVFATLGYIPYTFRRKES
jgi:hypothetical protein